MNKFPWLVERRDHHCCIGERAGRIKDVAFTSRQAVWFDTEQEAEAFIELHGLDAYKPVQHWYSPQPHADNEKGNTK